MSCYSDVNDILLYVCLRASAFPLVKTYMRLCPGEGTAVCAYPRR